MATQVLTWVVTALQAMCKRFWEYCQDKGITLPTKNFSLSYSTTIPRQCGLRCVILWWWRKCGLGG